jgi:hypothetical protein
MTAPIATPDPVNKSYRVGAGLFSGAAAMTFPIANAICNLLREYGHSIPDSLENAWIQVIVMALGLLGTGFTWWSKLREKSPANQEKKDKVE